MTKEDKYKKALLEIRTVVRFLIEQRPFKPEYFTMNEIIKGVLDNEPQSKDFSCL